eukprot:7011209-Prymnesium_polylepis.1
MPYGCGCRALPHYRIAPPTEHRVCPVVAAYGGRRAAKPMPNALHLQIYLLPPDPWRLALWLISYKRPAG